VTITSPPYGDLKDYGAKGQIGFGLSAMLKLLRSILKHHGGRLDAAAVLKYLKPLRKAWTDKQWKEENMKSFVGNKGWSALHSLFVGHVRNEMPDFRA